MFLCCREIIDDEMQVDQMSGRSRYHSGQIMSDPNAPAKPPKFSSPMDPPMIGGRGSIAAPPMVRVGSDSGIGSRMSTVPRANEPHPQQMSGHVENMESWGEVCPVQIVITASPLKLCV